jgi:hypothetical protein
MRPIEIKIILNGTSLPVIDLARFYCHQKVGLILLEVAEDD